MSAALQKYEKDEGILAQARKLKNVPWCDDYEKMICGMQYVVSTNLLAI